MIDSEVIVAAYEGTPKKDIRAALLVEYRCASGCLVLHVWQSPGGMLFYHPRYRLSPARTESSTAESARAIRTSDGDRRWRSRGGVLDGLRGWGDEALLTVQCDHIEEHIPSTKVIAAADSAMPGKPVRHRI